MRREAFGATEMKVAALGLGGAEIGFENSSDQTVDHLVGTALDVGINVIDTAAMYADSEEKLGRTLFKRRKQFFIFTKCGRFAPPAQSVPGFVLRSRRKMYHCLGVSHGGEPIDWHPRALNWNIEQSLRRLRTDYIDVIQLHSCSAEILRKGDAIEVLRRAREAGKVRHIGYTGDGETALYALRCGHFESVQMSINVADQEAYDLAAALAIQRGIGVVAKRPVANGLWRNVHRPDNRDHQAYWDRLQKLQYDFLRSERAFEIALRFTLTIPGVRTAIVGTTNPAHLLQNAKYAASGPLAQHEFEAIRGRWKMVSAPDWVGQT